MFFNSRLCDWSSYNFRNIIFYIQVTIWISIFWLLFWCFWKRKPQIEDLIDRFLIAGNFNLIQNHNEKIQYWKKECQQKIDKSKLKKYRIKQYQECIDDNHAFQFNLTRRQTRYQQMNYVKTSYKVTQITAQFTCDYLYLLNRNNQLKDINYECTLREYHSKNQRKLITPELRKRLWFEIIILVNIVENICRME